MSFPIDSPLFSFTGYEADAFTIRNCFTGFQIFGGTGSGKTSGSGKFLAKHFLNAGFGGLVLTVKPDECNEWQEWAKENNRQDALIIFKPSNPYRFDFLSYEQNREGEGAGSTFNIVDLLITACDITKPDISESSGEKFWEDAANELIAKTVDLLLLSNQSVTVSNILKIINSAPLSGEEKTTNSGKSIPKCLFPIGKNDREQPIFTPFATAIKNLSDKSSSFTKQQKRDAIACQDYFLKDYALLGDRTRSSIKIHVTTTLYQLLRGDLGLLFCNGKPDDSETEISPEVTYKEGKIIIVDMPIMEWKETGKLAQGLFKYMFQRSIERRNFNNYPTSVFLWADEAQYFLNRSDQMFLTTARSAGCSTVYLTQNIENYYSIMEESVARSMLGNLQTKIFHQNSDISTNEFASKIIGKVWGEVRNRNVSFGTDDNSDNYSSGSGEQLINKVEPDDFNYLTTGGIQNNLTVEGVIFSGGRIWVENQEVYETVSFKQS